MPPDPSGKAIADRSTHVGKALALVKGMEPFPGYRLTHFLGKGGWGEVWKAVRPDGKAAALKFLPCDNQLTSVQEIRALQAIRQLKHPHLLEIHQIWSGADSLVIAMEMAEGSLSDLLEIYYVEFGYPIIPEHVCFFLVQAASAIDFLNTRQHVVNGQRVAFRHCDVKPSNLLLVGKSVKLADFSLSVQTTSPMWYHRRVGTLSYSAPEIFQGWLSEWTDQYALAVTYCQLRGGRLPFTDTPEGFIRGYIRPTPDLTMLSLPERPIIARGLAPVPQDRWPSCTEMLQRLQGVLAQTGDGSAKPLAVPSL
jgi:serine/threonine-protein kinase